MISEKNYIKLQIAKGKSSRTPKNIMVGQILTFGEWEMETGRKLDLGGHNILEDEMSHLERKKNDELRLTYPVKRCLE